MKYINQRQSPRIEIRLQCQVSAAGLCRATQMETENISRTGVLLAWPAGPETAPAPRPGQLVTIEIELPAEHGFGRKCIHCQAVVVRVDPRAGGGSKVGLRINYMKFGEISSNIRNVADFQLPERTWLS